MDTGLKTFTGESIVLDIDQNILNSLYNKLYMCSRSELPAERVPIAQLCDEYYSATIEGAQTSIEKVMDKNFYGHSEIMVRQSLFGLQRMFELSELTPESIIEVWKIVTKDCCENTGAGTDGFRTGMVYVAGKSGITHVPAQPSDIPNLVENLCSMDYKDPVLSAIILSFYLVYIHPFADGNGRLSRILIQYCLGIKGLPIAKAIHSNVSMYYKSLRYSEAISANIMDISAYAGYLCGIIDLACDMYKLLTNSLSSEESLLLSKIDKTGKGTISIAKASNIFDDILLAFKVLNSLEDKGYLHLNKQTGDYTLLWR